MKIGLRIELKFEDTRGQSGPALDQDDFASLLDAIADELTKLDIQDPFVGANLESGMVEVELHVPVKTDHMTAFEEGLAAVRAAIHAAGVATPGWDLPDDLWRVERAEVVNA